MGWPEAGRVGDSLQLHPTRLPRLRAAVATLP